MNETVKPDGTVVYNKKTCKHEYKYLSEGYNGILYKCIKCGDIAEVKK